MQYSTEYLSLKIIIAGAVNLTLVFYYAADPL